MDIEFQMNNEGAVTQRDLEYDPLLEQAELLELDDLFDEELSVPSSEPLVYVSSTFSIETMPEPSQKQDKEGYVDPAPEPWSGVDSTDYYEENGELTPQSTPRDSTFRLTVIERTLGELQKYIGELIVLVREELDDAQSKNILVDDELPPFPDTPDAEPIDGTEQYSLSSLCEDEIEHDELDTLVVRGIFNGQSMVAPDGREFAVPENYASKSRLVHGDTLALTISAQGKMTYKQVGPVQRRRITGIVEQDPSSGQYSVLCPQGRFRVLTASVHFFKGVPGDDALILIPVGGPYKWGAVQSIIKE